MILKEKHEPGTHYLSAKFFTFTVLKDSAMHHWDGKLKNAEKKKKTNLIYFIKKPVSMKQTS